MNNIIYYIIFIIGVLFSTELLSQQDSLQDRNRWILGTWVNTIDKTPDGKEYKGLICRDTIQYNKNGSYLSKQCTWDANGKWRFTDDKNIVIHYDIKCAYWEKILGTNDIGESHGRLISLSRKEMITVIYSEVEGEVWQYYTKLK